MMASIPKNVVVVDAQMHCSFYRLRFRWDGSIKLLSPLAQRIPPYLALLDASLVFRRNMDTSPTQGKVREALLKTANEYFPFSPETTRYAMGMHQGSPCYYALPNTILSQIPLSAPEMQVLLVADQAKSLESLILAIDLWLEQGKTVNLGATPVAGKPWARIALSFLLLVCAALVSWMFFNTGLVEKQLRDTMKQYEAESKQLRNQYLAIQKMSDTNREIKRLHDSPGAATYLVAGKILETLPINHSIKKMEFKKGGLSIEGEGNSANPWLESNGFQREEIITVDLPKYSRFTAERKTNK